MHAWVDFRFYRHLHREKWEYGLEAFLGYFNKTLFC